MKPSSLQATKPLQSSGLITPAIPVYTEPEFIIDHTTIKLIVKMDIIPKQYLIKELETFSKKENKKLNYITATYFLLVKR